MWWSPRSRRREPLGDERRCQWPGAVNFDAVAQGVIAVKDGEDILVLFGKSEREGGGGAQHT